MPPCLPGSETRIRKTWIDRASVSDSLLNSLGRLFRFDSVKPGARDANLGIAIRGSPRYQGRAIHGALMILTIKDR